MHYTSDPYVHRTISTNLSSRNLVDIPARLKHPLRSLDTNSLSLVIASSRAAGCGPRKTQAIILLEIMRVTLHEQSDDQTKQSKNSSEDLDSQNLDETRCTH
jgi:hypothetical protein